MERVTSRLAQSVTCQEPLTLRIDHLGFFGRRHQPRILWAGVSGDLQQLQTLQRAVVTALVAIGFPKDKRPYRPHITIAKNYRRDDFPSDQLAAFPITDFAQTTWQVRDIVLYRTHLGQSPMYEVVGTYSFQEGIPRWG